MGMECNFHVVEFILTYYREKCFFKIKNKAYHGLSYFWKVKMNAIMKKIHKDYSLHGKIVYDQLKIFLIHVFKYSET